MRNSIILLASIVFASTACQHLVNKSINGNGNIISKEKAVAAFKNVKASGIVHVYLRQGALSPAIIETDENLIPYITVLQEGDKILIKTKEGYNLLATDQIKVHLTTPTYNTIEVSGAGNAETVGKIENTDGLSLNLSGAGNANISLHAPEVKLSISGAGKAQITGETKNFLIGISGTGEANCFNLLTENTKATISGAGNAKVYASTKLDATISGAGSIYYKGGVTNITQKISGAGKIKKQANKEDE
jgi:hypothetical protein